MFWYNCTNFRTKCQLKKKKNSLCKAVIYKVLQYGAALLLMLIKYERYNCTDF